MSTRTTEFAAQITGDANGAIKALEQVKVRVAETGKAAESANTKVASSTRVLIKESEKAAKGVASITQALYAMEAEGSARVLALGGAVGNFADLLGPGGKVVSGVAIVASSIAALFLQAKEKSAEATKAIEADIKQLVNAGDFAAITKRLQEIEQGTAGAGFSDGRSAIRERIAQLTAEVQLAGKSNRFYLERQKAIIEEKKKLQELTAEYNRYYKALTDPTNAPSAPRGLAGQPIVSSANSVEKTAADAKKASDELKKAAKAFDDAFAASLFATQAAIAEAGREIEERQAKLQEALSKESTLRRENNTELGKELQALQAGTTAYEAYLIVRAQEEAVADAAARAKAAGIELTDAQAKAIREEIAERLRLQKIVEAFKELNGQNPFSIPTEQDFARVGQLADTLAKAASAASGIASAFGEAGAEMANLLAKAAALATNVNSIQRAGIFKDANGVEQNVGALGALRGQAGSAGQLQAVTGVLGVLGTGIGIIQSWNASAKAAAEAAKEAARALNEMRLAARRSVEEFSLQASGTPIERELAGLEQQFRGIIKALLEAGAPATARLGRRTAVNTQLTAADVDKAIDAYEKLVEAAKRAAEFEARQAELTDDARLLAAQGRVAEAEAIRLLAANEKELEEARLAGADVAKKIAIQEAEAAKREADRVREQLRISGDVAVRRADLAGDTRGAFVLRQQSFAASAIQEAEALFAAGTITAELFEDLKRVIGEELVDAIADFDAAAAEAAQLEQLQAMEAAALAVAKALEEALQAREAARSSARNRVALFDLSGQAAFEQTLAAYGTAFAGLFANFDLTTLGGIDSAKDTLRAVFDEIAGLSDTEVLAQFGMTRDELVAALLDTNSGLSGLADALTDVADRARQAAEEAAEFAESIGLDFLRSQGRGQDADTAVAKAKRDDRIRQAQQLGLGASVLAQIEAIYQADVAEIAARYATAGADAAASVAASSAKGSDTVRRARASGSSVRQEFGGLAEVTGQTLAGLLREVAINTGRSGAIVEALLGRGGVPSLAGVTFPSFAPGAAGGSVVNSFAITVHVGAVSSGAMSPTEAGQQVAQAIAREVGRLASAEVQFLGGAVR